MIKTKVFLVILFSLLLVSSCYAQLDSPRVIFNDKTTVDFYNVYSWGLSDDETYFKVGVDSLKVVVPASSQYQAVYLDFEADLTLYDTLCFWWKGNASGYTLRVDLASSYGVDFYYYFIIDDRLGWEWFEIPLSSMSSLGSPDISNINFFGMQLSSNNGAELTLFIDYATVFIGDPVSIPEDSPEKTEYIIDFESIFLGEWAFIGVIIWIILGLFAIKLNKYAGIFVFVLSMLYEVFLYDNLDKFGNNIYYMIILIFYAIFSAWSVFNASGE